ncbi:uncharacterized protein MP3633_2057 [Marinomonas primoryensis]|uniref:Uncharacterized protein n=1 Tax=Marinomonas primoryensis TaxID=178399 RepID=A0A859CW65_9GAMM|nr:uncharacterized protein MP3633_2057 [Marinomonas primoryensis]
MATQLTQIVLLTHITSRFLKNLDDKLHAKIIDVLASYIRANYEGRDGVAVDHSYPKI